MIYQNIQIYSFNLASLAKTVITADHVDEFWPAINLKHDHTTKVYRSPSGQASSGLTFDMVTVQPVTAVLVKGSTLDGLGFVGDLVIKAKSVDADWANPDFQINLTPNPEFNFGAITFAEQNYRYWRIEGTGTDYFELANLFIGDKFYMDKNNISLGWSVSTKDNSKISENEYGQRFSDKRNKRKQYKGNFKNLTILEAEALEDVFDELGITNPFWMILNQTNDINTEFERHSGQFYLNSLPTKSNPSFSLYSMPFSARECV